MSIVDTCNVLLTQALSVFSGPGGVNDQLETMSLNPPLAPVGSILKLSAPLDAYEKTASVRYPAVTLYCERLRNTQMEKFRVFSGNALLVAEIRASGARAEDLETDLNSYVEAACRVLENYRGAWTEIGTYTGAYDVKFQAMRPGGKQFTKMAQIVFEVQVSK
jgi:hypothetical protein